MWFSGFVFWFCFSQLMCTYDENYWFLHSLEVGKLEKLAVYQILICPTVSNEDLEAAIASLRASTTESKAVCRVSSSEARLVTVQEVVLCEKAETWLNTTLSNVFAMKGRMEPGM